MTTVPAEFDLRIDLSGPATAAGIGTAGGGNVQANLNARPTAETLAAAAGSAGVGHIEVGDGAIAGTVQSKLRRLGKSVTDFGATAGQVATGTYDPPGPEMSFRFNNAFIAMHNHSDDVTAGAKPWRAYDPSVGLDANWGVGTLTIPKGRWNFQGWSSGFYNCTGLTIQGDGCFATTLTCDKKESSQIDMVGYNSAKIADLSLFNKASEGRGTSVGINLNEAPGGSRPTGGGFMLMENVVVSNFATGIRIFGGVDGAGNHNPGDGDKTLVIGVTFGCDVGFDRTDNKQAIGWTFLNCYHGCSKATYRLGGAGELLIANDTTNVGGSYLQIPESSGNWGDYLALGAAGHGYLGWRTTVMSTKLEYAGLDASGHCRLVDGRECLKRTADGTWPVQGGSNIDLVLREVAIDRGIAVDEATNRIIEFGNGTNGPDAIRLKQEGGSIPGVIRWASTQTGRNNRHWRFRDAIKAPSPTTAQFLGTGNHALMEWTGNENVRLDQFRGGQAATFSIPFQKAYRIFPNEASATRAAYLIDTAVNTASVGLGTGQNFTIVLPDTDRDADAMGGAGKVLVPQLSLFVLLSEPAAANIQVEQFADASFGAGVSLGSVTIPAGQRGLFIVHGNLQNITTGQIYVRVSAAGAAAAKGHLVFVYHPDFGV
jgi:hypothetical protein